MADLHFAIKSQTGDEIYELRVFTEDGLLFASCTCAAGAYGYSICKHRISILRGEQTMLASPSDQAALQQLVRIKELLLGTPLAKLVADLASADEQMRAAKARVSAIKQELNRAMEEGSPTR